MTPPHSPIDDPYGTNDFNGIEKDVVGGGGKPTVIKETTLADGDQLNTKGFLPNSSAFDVELIAVSPNIHYIVSLPHKNHHYLVSPKHTFQSNLCQTHFYEIDPFMRVETCCECFFFFYFMTYLCMYVNVTDIHYVHLKRTEIENLHCFGHVALTEI